MVLLLKKYDRFRQRKMLKGKNILYGSGLYLAAIWALYNQKKVTYKDQKELEASVPMIGGRKSIGGQKDAILRERAAKWGQFKKSKQFAEDPKSFEEFGAKFVKLGYVR